MRNHLTRNALIAVAALAAVISFQALTGGGAVPVANAGEKVTFCHAAGQAGTTKFVTLTTSVNAAFGQAGHFNEDGTPAAGHEQDYLGPCEGSPSPSPNPSPSESPSPST